MRKMFQKIVFFILQLFSILLFPHKDKLVMHCINDILMNFLSSNEISCHRNLKNLEFLIILRYIREVLKHLSYKGQNHRVQ